jgi:hypothetical protein
MKFAVVVWTFCGGFVVAVGKLTAAVTIVGIHSATVIINR